MLVFRKLMGTSSMVCEYLFIFCFVMYKIWYFLLAMVLKIPLCINLNVMPITVSCGGIVTEKL
jgi:hypothetical protein